MLRKILAGLILLFALQSVNAEWIKQNVHSLAWFHDVFFLNENKGWIVGGDGVMLSTEDGGRTWVRSPKFTADTLLQIHFTSETTGWLLCERNIYMRGANASSYLRKTTDGGRTWEQIEFQDGGRERVTRLLFDKNGDGTAFGEGGIFYRLQEDGTAWKKTPNSIHFLLLDGAFSDGAVGAIAGAGGTILFTNDHGRTWEKASILGDADTRFNAIYFSTEKTAVAVGTRGRIFRSNAGCRLWRQVDSGTTSNLNDAYFTDAANGWAVGDNGVIIRTRDGGKSWTEASSHVTHNLEKVTFAGQRGWAVGFGGTVLIYDPGATNSAPGQKPTLQRRI